MVTFTRFCVSLVCSVAIAWYAPVIGTDRNKNVKCPADVRDETRICLRDYADQLEALLHSDSRFFPGLDVEVIRSLCSSLDESMRCVHGLVSSCPRSEVHVIEEELSPHLGVRQLCVHDNIYEEYAMNQNCFVRIRSESESCYHSFIVAVQNDDPVGHHSSSSSSLSSSSQQDAPQQRLYCGHLRHLVACVKNLVRSSTTSCQRMALKLVDVLVKASLPSTIHCKDESNATTPHSRHAVSTPEHRVVGSSGTSLHGPFKLWYVVLASTAFLHFICNLRAFGHLTISRLLRLHHGCLSPESSR